MTLSQATSSLQNSAKFVAGFFFLTAVTIAFAVPVKFDIPAQPAPSALMLFIKQSKAQVAYSAEDLQNVTTNAVTGEFEPSDALARLLKDTGFAATERKPGYYTVVRTKAEVTTGSVRGSLTGEGGKGLPNVLVAIKETAQSTETDRYGVFVFPNVAAGTYVLVASAPGYQTMKIDGVNVKAGRDLTIGKEEMRKAPEGPLALEPVVVHADTVEQLEKFEVTGTKQKPFSDGNVDLPRGIDDAQPYYIFDSKSIDQSGAINVEDFLKNRLPMNTLFSTSAQNAASSSGGNTSAINLRGLGTASTLVLVDGRRVAGAVINSTTNTNVQPDINGIPLAAIDHIEVLPSSASGIYGGNALGGVVNIILKKDFSGGEIRATYDNTWGSDAPTRTISMTYGLALEGGKTHVLLSTQYSNAKPLTAGDRIGISNRGVQTTLKNQPTIFQILDSPLLGLTPNILSDDGSNLTLVSNGASLNSPIATLPKGYSVSSSPTTIIGGQWNLTPPPTNQQPNGLLNPLSSTPREKALMASLRRDFSPNVALFANFSYTSNHAVSNSSIIATSQDQPLFIPAGNPINPFNQDVDVSMPESVDSPSVLDSSNLLFSVGAIVKLPKGWSSETDYTWSQSKVHGLNPSFDAQFYDDQNNGVINPFVDTLLYPRSLQKYVSTQDSHFKSELEDVSVRLTGPLFELPTGTPTLAVLLEHRRQGTPGGTVIANNPLTVSSSTQTTDFAQWQSTNSGYIEATLPIVTETKAMPLVRLLDLQVAGRTDSYTVDSGTTSVTYNPFGPTPTTPTRYTGPTLNGQPYRHKASYASSNETLGLRWKPVQDVMIRASFATAFLPPTPDQLLQNPLPDANLTQISDPQTGKTYKVQTISGGNASLKPQNAKSWDGGIVWTPSCPSLKGLRVDLEYYKIYQFEKIGSLSAQQIISDSFYANRVTRNTTTGLITLVDTSLVNLTKSSTSGIDLSVGYRKDAFGGTIDLYAIGSLIKSDRRQASITSPVLDYVGFPISGGEVKDKGNVTLTWEKSNWSLGWTTRYFGPYFAFRASPGDPSWNGKPVATGFFSVAYRQQLQGSDHIPAQVYHDVFFSYSFRKSSAKKSVFLDGLTIEGGIKNIFNTWPPFEALGFEGLYDFQYSPLGDIRLRDYWISVRKAF